MYTNHNLWEKLGILIFDLWRGKMINIYSRYFKCSGQLQWKPEKIRILAVFFFH